MKEILLSYSPFTFYCDGTFTHSSWGEGQIAVWKIEDNRLWIKHNNGAWFPDSDPDAASLRDMLEAEEEVNKMLGSNE